MKRQKRHITWDIESRCNLSCKHCLVSDSFSCNSLSLDEKKRVVDHLVSCGIKEIKLIAMEPLFSRDAINFFKYCRYSNIKISLTTNGTLIDDEAVNEFSKGGFSVIAISLEGFSEKTNDLIRGEGSFNKAIAGIDILTQNFKRNNITTPIVVQICINPFNSNEIIEKLGSFIKKYPTIKVSFGRIIGLGEAEKNTELVISRNEYMDAVQVILKKYHAIRNNILIKDLTIFEKIYFNNKYDLHFYVQPSKCSAYTDRISIMPDGNLCRCSLLLKLDIIPHEFLYLNKSVFEMPNIEIEDLTSRFGPIKNGFCLECPFREECGTCIVFTKNRQIYPELVESCEKYYRKIVEISKKIIYENVKFRFRSELSISKRGDYLIFMERGKKEVEINVNYKFHIPELIETYYTYNDLPFGEDNILKLLLRDIIRINPEFVTCMK